MSTLQLTRHLLTALTDNALGQPSWHLLPNLALLEVHTCPPSLVGFSLPTQLRALALYTGADEGLTLDSLAPLSALSNLEHLDVEGKVLPLPELGALTQLTLHFRFAADRLPALASTPLLQVLELWLVADMTLPGLKDCANLKAIHYNNDDGALAVDVSSVGLHNCVYTSCRRSVRAVDRGKLQ